MNYFNSKTNPRALRNPLKVIIMLTVILSLFAAIFDALFPYFFKIPGPQVWLSLSYWGLKHYFFWQPFSYFFMSQTSGGLSISFFISLFFNMYFLSMVGSSLIQTKGRKDFLWLYLGGGCFTGIVMTFILFFTHSPLFISGSTPALYCLLTAWMMLVPEVQVLLFFTIPIKVKWLITGILAMNLLVDLSQGHFLNFILFLIPAVYGYFYALLVWKTHSPFKGLYPLEKHLIATIEALQKKIFPQPKFDSFTSHAKIYDFKTGKAILNDEDFMDGCLAKIALHGKSSLTFFERFRMKRISKKRKKMKKKL